MTTKVNKTLTLNRWHKVVDRLNQAVTEATATAQKKLLCVNYNVMTKQAYSHEEVLAYRNDGLAALARAETLLLDIANIRVAVGVANVQHEISQKLAKADLFARIQNMLKAYDSANDGKIDFAVFETVSPVTDAGAGRLLSNVNSYGIKVLNDADVLSFKDKANAYKKQLTALSDEVSDLNRMKVSIELSEEAVQAAALAD